MFSEEQQIAIALTPKFTSFASILGSSCILYEILVLDPRKLKRVYHRILLAMSIYDVISSSWDFQSSWPIPKGTEGVAFAMGNTEWCEAQGFFVQFSMTIPILNMCLAIYYLLVIKYSWTEESIRVYAEPLFHLVSFGFGFGTACTGLVLKLYNNANLWCWFAAFPPNCLDSFRYGDEANCIRGDNAWIYRWAFFYVPLWCCILVVMVAMIAVYFTVRCLKKYTTRRLDRQEVDGSSNNNNKNRFSLWCLFPCCANSATNNTAQRVANQALWHVGAFCLTFFFPTLNRVVEQVTSQTYFALVFLHAVFKPMQGLLNYLVYIRPRYIKILTANPSEPFWKIWWLMIKRTAQCYVSYQTYSRVYSNAIGGGTGEGPSKSDNDPSDELDETYMARDELNEARESSANHDPAFTRTPAAGGGPSRVQDIEGAESGEGDFACRIQVSGMMVTISGRITIDSQEETGNGGT